MLRGIIANKSIVSLRFSVAGEGDLSRSAEITRRCNRYLGTGEKRVLDRKMNAIRVSQQ